MPNTLSIAWVKNVYSLGIVGGIDSGLVYTAGTLTAHRPQNQSYKSLVLPSLIPAFSPQLSTSFLRNIPLLIAWLYPQSTIPTIKRTKER
jgi:hypothetical protein